VWPLQNLQRKENGAQLVGADALTGQQAWSSNNNSLMWRLRRCFPGYKFAFSSIASAPLQLPADQLGRGQQGRLRHLRLLHA
jgi:hypothetical protein